MFIHDLQEVEGQEVKDRLIIQNTFPNVFSRKFMDNPNTSEDADHRNPPQESDKHRKEHTDYMQGEGRT